MQAEQIQSTRPPVEKSKPYNIALLAFRHHPIRLALMLMFQIILRFIAALPLLYAFGGGVLPYLDEQFTLPICAILWLLLYIFLVMPFRIWGAGVLCYCIGRSRRKLNITRKHYMKWLRLSGRKLKLLLPTAIPLIAVSVFIYLLLDVWYDTMPFNNFLMIFNDIGAVFGGRYDAGLLVLAVATVVSMIVLAVGCWWNQIIDYQPVIEIGCKHAIARAKDARQQALKQIVNVFFVNILLSIPAIVGYTLIAYLFTKEGLLDKLALANDMQAKFLIVINFIKSIRLDSIPSQTMLLFVLCELILHLPFMLWRKMSYAVVIQKICRKRDGMRYVDTRG